jgi:hypothetical protein
MGSGSQVDVEIRAGDIVTLVSAIVEKTESGGTEVINSPTGFTGDEDIYFVLVDSNGEVILDAETATIVDQSEGTVSYALTSTYTMTAGRFTYYWIIDDLAGTGARRRTEDLTLTIGPRADTFGDA